MVRMPRRILFYICHLFSSAAHGKDHEQKGESNDHPYSEYSRTLCTELVIIPFQVDDDHNPRQDVCHVAADEGMLREFQSAAGICLPKKVIPTPACLVCTKHQIDDRAKWKDVVGYEEIFKVHDV